MSWGEPPQLMFHDADRVGAEVIDGAPGGLGVLARLLQRRHVGDEAVVEGDAGLEHAGGRLPAMAMRSRGCRA